MKRTLATQILVSIVIAFCLGAGAPKRTIYPDRWVYVSRSFRSEKDVEDFRELARSASNHGFTGILLSGMDRISLWPPDSLERIAKIKQIADENHLEIIPAAFNTGYGGALLDRDKNLAEGLLVKDALFVAKNGTAHFQADSPARVENQGFEDHDGNRIAAFTLQDEPGVKTFVDTAVFHSGKASLRIEKFATGQSAETAAAGVALEVAGLRNPSPANAARIAQEIRVRPYRCYRVSAWVKTENAQPASLFSIKSFTPDGRDLSPFEPPAPAPTSNWRRVTTAFNSWYADRILLELGVFGGEKGRVWVDDLEVEEVGLMNVIRREGAPLTVRDEKSGVLYEEGRDFAAIDDPQLDFHWTHAMPSIRLLPGGHIHDGARLRVSYYHGTALYNDQTPACPSDPKVREIWKQQLPLIEKYLAPKRYFLNIDEVRAINRDQSCRRRKMTPGAIIGETTRWLYDQIHAVNPKAQVLVWSDMFDPGHNAVERYFLVDGSLQDTWTYLPKDIGVMCWYFERRRSSLDFFAGRGFKTFAAAYYDAKDLKSTEENAAGWLDALDTTPAATGIMYTTWGGNYRFLPEFGDLVSKER